MLENFGKLFRIFAIDLPRTYLSDSREMLDRAERILAPHIARLQSPIEPARALRFAKLIDCAYRFADEIDRSTLEEVQRDYEEVRLLPRSSDCQADGLTCNTGRIGLIVTHGDEAIVALRGTADSFDWMANVIGGLSPARPSFINSVYLGLSKAIAYQVDQYLDAHEAVQRVTFAGHSMGGALAQLAHRILFEARDCKIPMETVTFGSPAIGAELDMTGEHVLRIYRAADYVARCLDDGFAQTGKASLLTEDGVLVCLDESGASQCIILLNYAKLGARCDGLESYSTKNALWMLFAFLEEEYLNTRVERKEMRRPPGDYKLVDEHSIAAYIASLMIRGARGTA